MKHKNKTKQCNTINPKCNRRSSRRTCSPKYSACMRQAPVNSFQTRKMSRSRASDKELTRSARWWISKQNKQGTLSNSQLRPSISARRNMRASTHSSRSHRSRCRWQLQGYRIECLNPTRRHGRSYRVRFRTWASLRFSQPHSMLSPDQNRKVQRKTWTRELKVVKYPNKRVFKKSHK